MTDHRVSGHGPSTTEPGLFERLRRFREAEGDVALARKSFDVVVRSSLTYAALATYYPAVTAAAIRWRLRPQTTVIRQVAGECRHPGGRYAIFLVYQPTTTPWYVENALAALRGAGINTLLVFNHELDPEREAAFRKVTAGILIRNNAGLDIGGYRDGYLALRDEPSIERLLFLNDSVYFFEEGLAALFGRLMASRADVSAPFENRQFHHHIQSFCLSISGAMVRHPAIRGFFERYIPVSSRRWAIHEGEVGFSRILLDTAGDVEIVYRLEGLLAREDALPIELLPKLATLLPIALRRRYEWMRRGSAAKSETPLRSLVSLAGSYSQVHTLGFVFRLLLGSPIIKRDLVFREQFSADEAGAQLVRTGHEGHLDEIVADLKRKGVGSRLRGIDRGRYHAGMI